MKKLLLLLVGLVWLFEANGQNLVRNPGMDSSYYCPIGLGDFPVINWFNPTGSSPDYFHSCNPLLSPSNAIGWQQPLSDSGYLGFASFISGSPNSREYIEGALLTPLDSGLKYCVEMYLSLSNQSEAASGNIGIYFSDTLVNIPFDSTGWWYLHYLPFTPDIEFPMVTDTANWVLVRDTFVATGGEQFFVIGNFRTGANTVVDTLYPFTVGFDSYYYVDNVSVTYCDDTTPPPPPPPPPPAQVSTLITYNAFSPNGDGVNDVFATTNENLIYYRLTIFNRWGNTLYETTDPQGGWNGTYQGGEVPDGTYFYLIHARGIDGKEYLLKGYVTLLR
ncbi:MAG: gliding motility-associated C-terminal domain-containing protein [Planktothrix rubescens PR223]|jgi:gliding motility-associated-like protein